MKTYIEAKAGDKPIHFDTEDVAGAGPERVSRRGETVTARMSESLENALADARPAADAVVGAFRGMAPDGLEIEFGLRLDAEAGAVITKTAIGAHFTVKLSWTSGDG